MPRRPRVEMAGYRHIVNRGVEQRDIFLEPSDYEKFLEILCDVCKKHSLILHSYCLMTNHYHRTLCGIFQQEIQTDRSFVAGKIQVMVCYG